jgi:1-acyl-sn-glycerol-3-phosphate acyltransferase
MNLNPLFWFITLGCKLGLSLLCKIDGREMRKIPRKGPLLAYSNHTGIIEAPIIYTQMQPRTVTALAKGEIWDNKFLGFIFNLWKIIPLHREETDLAAMRKAREALEKGFILGIAPEGTRSPDAKLQRAHGGIAMLALQTGVPLQAIAHWGSEKLRENRKKGRRTPVHFRVGRLFYLDPRGDKVRGEVRQQMADEMMYQIAAMLPEEYRGVYSDLSLATEKYIRWV